MISATKNGNKFLKSRFWKGKSVENVVMSPEKGGCIQVCMHIDHNKVMFKCINTTNLENT